MASPSKKSFSEIDACAFAFAKRGIVVGDTKQLPPVWNIEWPIDRLMIQKHQLTQLRPKEGNLSVNALENYGLLTSKGSIMKMAQNATAFYDIDIDTRGVMLTNHYRCRAPIINICNSMVYGGALKVVTSATEPKTEWRNPLGFLVTSSESVKLSSGSRCNYKEAELIANWIKEQRDSIITHYNNNQNKTLDLPDLLAVLTPYRGQVLVLKKAIANVLNEDPSASDALVNKLVIGTVHSLQGAERNIVIFSMVDTVQPCEEHFYDDGASLINVAVSRAKEVFIVAMDQKAINYARVLTEAKLRKPSDYLWYYTVLLGKRLNPCRLVLIESPNKIQHLESALKQGMELEVIATYGHLTQLDNSTSWDPLTANRPQWQNLTEKELQVYSRVAILWGDLEAIYIATDPDAEGECIAWHFINRVKEHLPSNQILQKRTVAIKRMRFHSLVKEEIFYAYANANDGLDAGLIKSALVRAFLDQIIARHYPHKLGLGSVNRFYAGIGRVQLAIIDIVNKFAVEQKQYAVQVEIPMQDHSNKLVFYLGNDKQGTPIIFNSEISALESAKILQNRLGEEIVINSLWQSHVEQLAEYPVINTATFLALVARVYQMPPRRTMEVLQALYEGQTQIVEEVIDG